MTTVKKFRFMTFNVFVHGRIQKIFADLVFQVENHHVVRVGGEQNIFTRIAGCIGEGLEISTLAIDGGRGPRKREAGW